MGVGGRGGWVHLFCLRLVTMVEELDRYASVQETELANS